MDRLDTVTDVRYWSVVLCCTSTAHISDLEVNVTDFEILSLKFLVNYFFYTFLLWKQLREIVDRTSVSVVTLTCGSWGEGQHDPYFTVHWFCLMSWRLFDVWMLYFGIMRQYGPTWPQIKCRSLWPIFHVQWFCLISWRLFVAKTVKMKLWQHQSACCGSELLSYQVEVSIIVTAD